MSGGGMSVLKSVSVYQASCQAYHIEPDPNILVALNCKVGHLSLGPHFNLANLLPLKEALKHTNHITSLSFRKCRLGSSLCYPLRDILKENKTIVHINLDSNDIDYHGVEALAEALKVNTTLKTLNIRNNRIKLVGAKILAEGLKLNKGLESVDVTGNLTTYEGIQAIEGACEARHIQCDTTGNALKEEILNSITHGFGVFLSLVGGFTLAHDAQGYPRRHQWGIGIYVFSLVALFMSSTLCHSFTFMKKTGMIFQIFDHAAIYLLIAGTYTPLCFVNLSRHNISIYFVESGFDWNDREFFPSRVEV
uniref:Uncharacterized protein n=1 Tax=Arcella intermedia TaxID=1963864 RepID=A0A6B2LB72_9EUKA